INFFYRFRFFTNRCCYRGKTDRTSLEFFNDGQKYSVVHIIETVLVNVKSFQCHLRDRNRNSAVPLYLREIPRSTQEIISDSGSATAPSSDLESGILFNRSSQNLCRTIYNSR